ncbi:MAG: MarR family transcriptional regulator [Bacteroidales bacterium]|nr:MarR family transcriptional regulator [Bacteroidales bacterium]
MSDKEKRIRETIEEAGKVFEKFGLTPMQGRIIAYFTVSDPPEKSFDDLVNYFRASKSSISNSLNYLLQNKIIDYKTYTSDRKRYFFITDSFLVIYFKKVLENVVGLKEYAYRTVSMRTPEYPAANETILKWIENANRFQETLENSLDKIKKDMAGSSL